MSSQTKFLMSMLFIVVIILCIVLTRFYFDVTKNTESNTHDSRVESIVRSYGDIQVFRSVNGNYGLLDADRTILIEPEWLKILDVTENMILVSGSINNQELIGGIDYEENVILPFVFRSVKRLGQDYWLGEVYEDDRCIIYDREYQAVFQESFDSVSYENKLMTLYNPTDTLYYDMSEEPPVFRRAEFSSQITDKLNLNWKIANQVYLAELTKEDLRRINRLVSEYMQMLQEGDFQHLGELTAEEYVNTLVKPPLPEDVGYTGISQFAFSRRESGAYDFTFMLNGNTESLNIHLYFRRNAENQMILTAADISTVAEG